MEFKIIKVIHHRCDEMSGVEYFFAPSHMNEEEVTLRVKNIREEMIKDATAIRNPPEKAPTYLDWNKVDQNKTVAQVKAEFADATKKYNEWKKENDKLVRPFSKRMLEAGFWNIHSIQLEKYIEEFNVYWGHNHGLDLNFKIFKWDH